MSEDRGKLTIEEYLVRVALPDGDVLRLSGKEPLVALDRVVSQQVRNLRDGEGRIALLLAPKGQFRALMAVCRAADETLVLAPRGRGGELAAQLGAYLKFNRVAVEPIGWAGGCHVVAGPGWREAAAALGVDVERVCGGGCAVAGGAGDRLLLLGQAFTGGEGATICAESARAAGRLDETLLASGAVEVDAAALELARIRAGFPAWGSELTDVVLPPEVGLDTLAISYTKGCYVGQETIARIKAYGHTNRTLVRVRQCDGPDLCPDLPLPLTMAGEDKPRGQLTSCVRHPERGWLGLALVRHELAAPGSRLLGARHAFGVLLIPAY